MTVTMPLTTFHNYDITVTGSHDNVVITDSYNVVGGHDHGLIN